MFYNFINSSIHHKLFKLWIDACICITACVNNRQVFELLYCIYYSTIQQRFNLWIVFTFFCASGQTKVHATKVTTKGTQEYTGYSYKFTFTLHTIKCFAVS